MVILRHSILFLILLLTAGCTSARDNNRDFPVQRGVLDLRAWNNGESDPVFLRGEWKFFWKQLARDGLSTNKGGYIHVPSTWNRTIVHGEEIPRYGYGTYQITVLLPKGLKFSLRIPSIDSAYCLSIDHEKPFCNGTVGTAEKDSKTRYYAPAVLDLPVSDKPITLTLSMSNYHYPRAGLRDAPMIGPQAVINAVTHRALAYDFLLFGALLVMGLYHAVMFLYRKNDWVPLYFALICFGVAARLGVTGEGIFYQFWSLSWNVGTAMEYLSWYLTVGFFMLYIHALFPDESSKTMRNIFLAISFSLSVFVLATPVRVYAWTIYGANVFTLFLMLYILHVLIRAAVRKNDLAIIFLVGTLILIGAVGNDLFFGLRLIHTSFIAPTGLLLFLFSQAILLSKRFSDSFSAVNRLTEELNALNFSLEGKVKKRTQELIKANEDIRHLSIMDQLTDCYNRRYIDMQLTREIAKVYRYEHALSVILLDLDHFKRINDAYGHLAGDKVLVEIASLVKGMIREGVDWVARYGGEEFLVVLPETSLEGADILAERLRGMIKEERIGWEDKTIALTSSFGVTGITHHENHERKVTMAGLMQKADILLYQAKRRGRDRVITETFVPPERER